MSDTMDECRQHLAHMRLEREGERCHATCCNDRFALMNSEASGFTGDWWQVVQEGPHYYVVTGKAEADGYAEFEKECGQLTQRILETLKEEGWDEDDVDMALNDLATRGMPEGYGY